MYKLYKKIQPTEEKKFGIEEVEDNTNPFQKGPCLISLFATVWAETDVNAALNAAMEMLRLKTNNNENTGIELKDFDAEILSIAYSEGSGQNKKRGKVFKRPFGRDEEDENFAKKYLSPLIESNGERLDKLEAMRNMRNVNMMTYCDATSNAVNMMQYIKERMEILGYKEGEIKDIISQVSIVGYATQILETPKDVGTTYVGVTDVRDRRTYS